MEVGDHYRSTRRPHASSVYRVVGASDEVTLLRITDANGRRAHTGEFQSIEATTLASDFAPAEDLDAGLSPVGAVRNAAQGLYWSVRRFLP
jgi:hypothetical protein